MAHQTDVQQNPLDCEPAIRKEAAGRLLLRFPCRAASRLISLWPKVILEVDNEGDLPIHQACRQGNRDLVAVLLQQEISQKDIKLIQLARLSLDLKYWSVS